MNHRAHPTALLAAIALLVAPRPFDAQTEQYPSPRLATAGTIAVGRRADLLLVDSNPLDDVGVLRTLGGVVLRGEWRPAPAR